MPTALLVELVLVEVRNVDCGTATGAVGVDVIDVRVVLDWIIIVEVMDELGDGLAEELVVLSCETNENDERAIEDVISGDEVAVSDEANERDVVGSSVVAEEDEDVGGENNDDEESDDIVDVVCGVDVVDIATEEA